MSELIKCKGCDRMVALTAYACPHCGARLNLSPVGCLAWGILIIIALIIAFGIMIPLLFWGGMCTLLYFGS